MSTDNGWGQYQKLVVNELNKHEKQLEDIKDQFQKTSIELELIKANIGGIKSDLGFLMETMRDSGTESVLMRVKKVEECVANIKAGKVMEGQNFRSKLVLYGTMFASFSALAGTIATALLT